jgi:nucleotide-binding universal stress UspA family protein
MSGSLAPDGTGTVKAESPEPAEDEPSGQEDRETEAETDPDDLAMAPVISRVIAATDFSTEADHALAVAIKYAGLLRASIEIVHVQPQVMYQASAAEAGAPVLTSLAAGESADIEQHLASRAARAQRAGLQCQTVSLKGPPADQILSRAATTGAELIVMGSHGRSGFKKVLLGSVAERVVQRARCPVLVVPPHDRAA